MCMQILSNASLLALSCQSSAATCDTASSNVTHVSPISNQRQSQAQPVGSQYASQYSAVLVVHAYHLSETVCLQETGCVAVRWVSLPRGLQVIELSCRTAINDKLLQYRMVTLTKAYTVRSTVLYMRRRSTRGPQRTSTTLGLDDA